MQFRYTGVDRDRHPSEGVIEAESTADAATLLEASGVTIESLDRVDDSAPGGLGSDSEPTTVASGSSPWGGRRAVPASGAPLEFSEEAEHRAARFEPYGPEPPPAPRQMPSRAESGNNFLFLFGAFFTGIALVFIAIGVVIVLSGSWAGLFFILLPMVHLGVGLVTMRMSRKRQGEHRELAESGVATVAEVDGVGRDKRVRINGRHPHQVEYRFVLDGVTHVGDYSTMNRALTFHKPGDQIWILYDPDDPTSNIIWPPV